MSTMFKRRSPRHDQTSASTFAASDQARALEDQRTNENVESRALVVQKLARGWQNPFVPSRFGWNAIRIHIDDSFDGNPAFQHGGTSEAFRIPMEYMAHAGYAIRYLEQQWFPQSMAAPDADLRATWQASVERDEVMIDPLIDWAETWSLELDFPSLRLADAVTWATFDEALHRYVNERYLTDLVEVRCSGVLRLGYAVRAAEYAIGMLGSAKAAPLDELHFQGQALLARGELLLRNADESDDR